MSKAGSVGECGRIARHPSRRVPVSGDWSSLVSIGRLHTQAAYTGNTEYIPRGKHVRAAKTGPLRRHTPAEGLKDFVAAAHRSAAFVEGVIKDLGECCDTEFGVSIRRGNETALASNRIDRRDG